MNCLACGGRPHRLHQEAGTLSQEFGPRLLDPIALPTRKVMGNHFTLVGMIQSDQEVMPI